MKENSNVKIIVIKTENYESNSYMYSVDMMCSF